MRLVSAFIALLFTLPASGQDVVPDTTDPASYYPLEVGNRWESVSNLIATAGPSHLRTMIVGDTLIEGEQWFLRREQGFRYVQPRFTLVSDVREPVRFDPEAATVVRWTGTEAVLDFPCRLDGPIPGGEPDCDPDVYASYDKSERTFRLGGGPRMAVSFDGAVPGPTFYAGIGEDGYYTDLVYVRVGGETYGEPIEGMHTLPDPTPPWTYYPLGIGDQWIYFDEVVTVPSQQYQRRTVIGDTTIEGRRYFVVEMDSYNLLSDAPLWESRGRNILRYDSTTTDVMQWGGPSGGERVHVCRLGADFGETDGGGRPPSCPYFLPWDDLPAAAVIGGEEYTVPSIKYPGPYPINFSPAGFAAGIGEMERGAGSAFEEYRLEYARVDGIEYGTYPVASDDSPDPTRLGVSLSPNPASGPVAVRLTLPEAAAVTVEAFDVRGRRVARTEAVLPAGTQRLDLDASTWALGLYVVRVTAGEAIASGTVVRR